MRIGTIHAVVYSANPEMVRTGAVDKDGRVQFSPKVEQHKPGTILEIEDPAVVRRLLEAGAIELLDAGREEMIEAASKVYLEERGISSSASPKPDKRWQSAHQHSSEPAPAESLSPSSSVLDDLL